MSNCTESHGYVFSVSIVIKNRNLYNNRIMYIKSVLEVHDIIQGPRHTNKVIIACNKSSHTLSLSSLVSRILFSFLDRGLVAAEATESVDPSRFVMLANNQC